MVLLSVQQKYILETLRKLGCVRKDQLHALVRGKFQRPGFDISETLMAAMLRQLRSGLGDFHVDDDFVYLARGQPDTARLEAIDIMLELSEGAPQEFTVKVDSPRLLCFTLGVDKLKLFSVALLVHISDPQQFPFRLIHLLRKMPDLSAEFLHLPLRFRQHLLLLVQLPLFRHLSGQCRRLRMMQRPRTPGTSPPPSNAPPEAPDSPADAACKDIPVCPPALPRRARPSPACPQTNPPDPERSPHKLTASAFHTPVSHLFCLLLSSLFVSSSHTASIHVNTACPNGTEKPAKPVLHIYMKS